MCGIGGILRTDGKPIPEEWLDAIDARIAWRGPDGHGRFRDRAEFVDERGEKRSVEVAFVHRRLSIIDHASGGQPMVSARGRNECEGLVAVVFNGCIYNHRDLRKELEAKGHHFVSDHSDTEVLIHGWREWGVRLVDQLEGMYAFAIWDRGIASIMLARDWFGEKPLDYFYEPFPSNDRDVIAFSSCAGPLVELCPERYQFGYSLYDEHWVRDYLQSGYRDLNAAAIRKPGIYEFPPGLGDLNPIRENAPDGFECESRPREWSPQATNEEAIEALLEQAVCRRLEADVPLGCFLSGGVDSSLIALFARKHDPAIRTFCVRMDDERYDESRFAEQVATRIGATHETLDVEQRPAEDLIHLISLLGQPFGDSSILPTYWVAKAARQHVKAALSGDGGDEMFLGYDRYLAARFLTRHWKPLRHLPARLLLQTHPKSRLHKLGRLVDMARDFPERGLATMEAIFTAADIIELSEHDVQGIECLVDGDPIRALRTFDIEKYLPRDLLRKVDTASMACGLEVRCPFLDRDVARAALSMPIEQLMPGGQRKGLLRRIARKFLPREIVDRPKMGFAIPIGEWFRSDYGGLKTLLLDHLNSTEPFGSISLNHKAVQRFIDEHMSGKRDHGQRLFTLLTLSIWAKSQQVNKSTSQK